MTPWLFLGLAHASCGPSGCAPPKVGVVQMPSTATAPVPEIDRARSSNVRIATFALG